MGRSAPSFHYCWTLFDIAIIDEFIKRLEMDKCIYVCQLEKCPSTSCFHYQGYCRFPKKTRPIEHFNNTIFDKIHWEKSRNIDASKYYCIKEETAEGDIRTNCPEILQDIKYRNQLLTVDKLRPWQKDIYNICCNEPDNRTINWIYDPLGGGGKSQLCKLIEFKFKKCIGPLCGKAADMKFAIAEYIDVNKIKPEIVLIDIPRSTDTNFLSYTGIEEIKNGFFFCTKYKSKAVRMCSPHVFIFSNDKPDLSKLTGDRWKLFQISEKMDRVYGLDSDID